MIDGKRARQGKELRTGYNKNIDGVDLVVWLKIVSQEPLRIEVEQQRE
jgi:hypothetical protein